ncbi:unnamed protein product [Lymnaea stagnalis]|uniref:Apple domain-containing protein n=1 Tax=Lymnaea stagnalis TaxID=6523 RepID=A0AAV2HG50_LYMST
MTMTLWHLGCVLVISSIYDNACATGKLRSAVAGVTSCNSNTDFWKYEELSEPEGVHRVLKCAMACQKYDSCVLAVFITRDATTRCLLFKQRTDAAASPPPSSTTTKSPKRNSNFFEWFMSYAANATWTISNGTISSWANTMLLNGTQWSGTGQDYQGQTNNNQGIQEPTTPSIEDYRSSQRCKVIKFRI